MRVTCYSYFRNVSIMISRYDVINILMAQNSGSELVLSALSHCQCMVMTRSHRQIQPVEKYSKHANFKSKFCEGVTVYLNINYIHTVLSKYMHFYVLIPENPGPGLVLGAQMSCCIVPQSSPIQAARRNSKYISFDLKIGVCIKCYVNFNIQPVFQCFPHYWPL